MMAEKESGDSTLLERADVLHKEITRFLEEVKFFIIQVDAEFLGEFGLSLN